MPRLPQNLNRPEIHSPTGDLVSSSFNMAGLREVPGIDTSGLSRGINNYLSIKAKTEADNDKADLSTFDAYVRKEANQRDQRNAETNNMLGVDISQNQYTNNLKDWINGEDDNGNPNIRSTKTRNMLNGRMQAYQFDAVKVSDKRKFHINRTDTLNKHQNSINQAIETYDTGAISQNVDDLVEAGYITPEEGVAKRKKDLNSADVHQASVLLDEDPIALEYALHDDQLATDQYKDAMAEYVSKPSKSSDNKSTKESDGNTESDQSNGVISDAGNPDDAELAKLEQQGRNNGNATNVGNPMDAELAKQMEDARKGIKPSTKVSTPKTGQTSSEATKTNPEPSKPVLNFPHMDEAERAKYLTQAKRVNKLNQVEAYKVVREARQNQDLEVDAGIIEIRRKVANGEPVAKDIAKLHSFITEDKPTTGKDARTNQSQLYALETIDRQLKGNKAKAKKVEETETAKAIAKYKKEAKRDTFDTMKLDYKNGEKTRKQSLERLDRLDGLTPGERLELSTFFNTKKPFDYEKYKSPTLEGLKSNLKLVVYGDDAEIGLSKYTKKKTMRYNKLLNQLYEYIESEQPSSDQLREYYDKLVDPEVTVAERLKWIKKFNKRTKGYNHSNEYNSYNPYKF